MNNIKIQSGKPIYGETELSGDPIDSLVLSTLAIFSEEPVVITNVPRSTVVLKHLDLLRSIGISIDWINSNTIKISTKEQIKSDLTDVITPNNHIEVALLVPAILFRTNECILTSSMRSELKFYREMGIEVTTSYNRFHLKLPLSNQAIAQKRVNLKRSHDLLLASRLLFQRIYPELSLVYRKTSANFSDIDVSISPEIQSSYKVGHNKIEFRMLTAAALASKGEISLSNFNLSDSLEYLLELEQICCSYEVVDNKIKIWHETKKLPKSYDFSGHDFSEVGYYALLLSLFSKNTIPIVCDLDERLEEMIRDLNILGCRIDIEKQSDNLVLKLKAGISIAPFKSEIVSPFWGGILLSSALSVDGTSAIRRFDILEGYMPDIIERLKALHIDVIS